MRREIRTFWKSILWAILVIALCFLPADKLPQEPFVGIPNVDKFAHAGFYFVFAIMFKCEIIRFSNRKKMSDFSVLAVVVILGGGIEILQATFFERAGEWADMLANVSGAVIGILAYRFIPEMWRRFL